MFDLGTVAEILLNIFYAFLILHRYDFLRFAKNHGEQSHTHIHAVLRLPEVRCPRIRIEILADLEYTRQRMHDAHATLGARHQLRCDNKVSASLLVFLIAGETLALNARHVENVSLGQDFVQ